ncbi:hypothetical protein CsSME_00053122 [Camellia sinensis var. sinensis]
MRHLDLSYNNFDEDAFRILGALPSLKFLSSVSNSMEGPLSNQVSQLYGEILEENGIDLPEMKILRREMEKLGIDSNICKRGQYNHLSCPMCKGGDSEEKSLFVFITANGIQLCGPVFKQNVAREAIQGWQWLDIRLSKDMGTSKHICGLLQIIVITVDWLGRATNWAKFSATAGLGVIHRGHLQQGRSLMAPYLPQSGAGGGGSPYSEGGALYALGLIHANHGKGIK